jgi:hypothetical protein
LLAVGVGGFLTYQSTLSDGTISSLEPTTTTESQPTISAEPKVTPVATPEAHPAKGAYQPEVKPSINDPLNSGDEDEKSKDYPSETDDSVTDENEVIPGC